jgi:hypothetical protein|tara:strand:- start:1478 stop:1726 length:249 start_codon:yes stop_codon:yes gene_type:complete
MKKTTKMNDGMNIMGREVSRTEPSLCARRKAAKREAERVLRFRLRLTHQHPLDRNGANKDEKTAEAWKEYDIALVKIREEVV